MTETFAFLEVIDIKEIGEGMRVCLDFVDILGPRDGVFIGNTGHGYIKVLSENRASDGYPPRPFRLNCGAIHQYLYQGGQTTYLHELEPGQTISLLSEEAEKVIPIGRIKIERRPFVRVECRTETGTLSATLQKASSVHLLEESRGEVCILDLHVGDRIECRLDQPGRHLGEAIDEMIIEK